MKITIFGGTGRAGRHLVEQALTAGHQVTALVRSPSGLDIQSEGLRVVQGDLADTEKVESAVAGADAVISVLGPAGNKPGYEISRITDTILAAMHRCGVRRLVVAAGAGVRDRQDRPGAFDHLISVVLRLATRHVYEDMVQVVQKVRSSGLDWTVVRVPMLTDGPATGNLKVGYLGQGVGTRVTRADMAGFMLEQASSTVYLHQAPVISN
jgi:putative NADH-flavin reductase